MAISEKFVPGDIVVWEADARYSRENATIGGSSESVLVGSVLEKSGDDYIVCTTEANAVAVALKAGTTGDVLPVIVRSAIVNYDNLDATGIALSEVVAPLLVKGIIARTGPDYDVL